MRPVVGGVTGVCWYVRSTYDDGRSIDLQAEIPWKRDKMFLVQVISYD